MLLSKVAKLEEMPWKAFGRLAIHPYS